MSTLFDRMNDEGGIIAPVGLTADQEKLFWLEMDKVEQKFTSLLAGLNENIDKLKDKDWVNENFEAKRLEIKSEEDKIIEKYQKIAEENKAKGLV